MAKKAPLNYFEDIVCFVKKYDSDLSNPVRQYSKKIKEHISVNKKRIFEIMGNQKICHFLRYDTPQFSLPTENTYHHFCKVFGIDKQD
jgi:site-specific DNA-methyltransferase (adenine-specific)